MSELNLSYKITDKALINISSIERTIATLNQNEISSRSRYRIESQSLFDDLSAINSFFKLNLPLGEIKKISIGQDIYSRESRLLSNIRQIFDYIRNDFNKGQINFNFYLVQHIIKLLQSGILEDWDIGKIRSGTESVDNFLELENQIYSNGNISTLLADAVLWVEDENNVHPFIKACVFMMFINTISPFVGLNFVSSLVFFRLILEKYGYGMNLSIPLFRVINNQSVDIRNILKQGLQNPNGISDVITEVTKVVAEFVDEYKKELIKFDYYEIKTNSEKLDFNDRQLKLLKLLQQKISIKRMEYRKLFKISPMTAYRDLNYLVKRKMLVISGQGKSTKYTLYSKATLG